MASLFTRALIATSLMLIGSLVLQLPTEAGSLRVSYASVGPSTSVPYGWVDFCNRYVGECDGPAMRAMDVNLTTASRRQIEGVNRNVNRAITAVSDMDHWGVVDRWDYPTDGRGDCEDYALLKRKLLIEAGFPRQALLMTVVKDQQNEGHAVLTVKTNGGEFVLDNLSDEMVPWERTGYRFVKRQSQEDPNIWVSLGAPISAPLFTSNR